MQIYLFIFQLFTVSSLSRSLPNVPIVTYNRNHECHPDKILTLLIATQEFVVLTHTVECLPFTEVPAFNYRQTCSVLVLIGSTTFCYDSSTSFGWQLRSPSSSGHNQTYSSARTHPHIPISCIIARAVCKTFEPTE